MYIHTHTHIRCRILPGPEILGMVCSFGMLSRGRPAAICAGLGYILPGACLILFGAWLYTDQGLNENEGYLRSVGQVDNVCVYVCVCMAVH